MKKTIKRQIPALILITICVGALAGACSAKDPLIGKWELHSGDFIFFFRYSENIEFKADGTAINHDYEGYTGKWSVTDGNKLTVKSDFGNIYEFTYQISGDMLTITDDENDSNVFQRVK